MFWVADLYHMHTHTFSADERTQQSAVCKAVMQLTTSAERSQSTH